jgi:hypothetical protein
MPKQLAGITTLNPLRGIKNKKIICKALTLLIVDNGNEKLLMEQYNRRKINVQ